MTPAELVAGIARREITAPEDLVDVALARAYLDPGDDGAHLGRAVAAFAGTSSPSLHGGRAGLGWVIAHTTDDTTVSATIDAALEQLVGDAWSGDFDLVSGLAGFGVYALEREAHGRALARRVVDNLERLAQPRGDGVAWFTPPELVPRSQLSRAPDGYWNAGLAHGTPGVIAVLARFVRADIEPARCRALLERAVAWLRTVDPVAQPRYRDWYSDAAPAARTPLAWCYGDLGIALALIAAATACDRSDWRDDALALARGSAAQPIATAGVVEPGLCHGAAGAALIFDRLHRVSDDGAFATASRAWLERTHELIDTRPTDVSFLTGTAGIALALHALDSTEPAGWERLLLVDL